MTTTVTLTGTGTPMLVPGLAGPGVLVQTEQVPSRSMPVEAPWCDLPISASTQRDCRQYWSRITTAIIWWVLPIC